jgi:hypothetical protein
MNDFAGMDCLDSVFSLPVAGCKFFTLCIVHVAYRSHSSGVRIAAVSACTLLGRQRSVFARTISGRPHQTSDLHFELDRFDQGSAFLSFPLGLPPR